MGLNHVVTKEYYENKIVVFAEFEEKGKEEPLFVKEFKLDEVVDSKHYFDFLVNKLAEIKIMYNLKDPGHKNCVLCGRTHKNSFVVCSKECFDKMKEYEYIASYTDGIATEMDIRTKLYPLNEQKKK